MVISSIPHSYTFLHFDVDLSEITKVQPGVFNVLTRSQKRIKVGCSNKGSLIYFDGKIYHIFALMRFLEKYKKLGVTLTSSLANVSYFHYFLRC